jgi:hypothetical protein
MASRELGVDSICCLLHNMAPGGSARQWIHLLARHVQGGGKATIVAPTGGLSTWARECGIELVEVDWTGPAALDRVPWSKVARHDATVVHWEHWVMHALAPALNACDRVALVLHQTPAALSGDGDEITATAKAPIDQAMAARNAVVLVRGEWHRRRFTEALDIPTEEMRILPASIPLPPTPAKPVAESPRQVLALMRLAPEKAPVARLAVALVRARLAAGEDCELTIAGEGRWRSEAVALCQRQLPATNWRLEPAPPDPIARLAAADLIVAQGLTTLEAAALGRIVVVARDSGSADGSGAVLTPDLYEVAAEDPFGRPPVSTDMDRLWREILAIDRADLIALRKLVAQRNSLEVASRALGGALAATRPSWPVRLRRRLHPAGS